MKEDYEPVIMSLRPYQMKWGDSQREVKRILEIQKEIFQDSHIIVIGKSEFFMLKLEHGDLLTVISLSIEFNDDGLECL